eukprot:TRINITY_DN5634_c0_g2_i4.p3 TRINITY_DN5634_c0_g2~~TRINITY_DN5634_c0_g2_i4.p3  ORF type:complete len:129 (-),score=35.68 TRINITY_DN5634_c0_g2_i4:222-608(-)
MCIRDRYQRRVHGYNKLQQNKKVRKRKKMVCDKCEKKLGKLANPDAWKDGARNTTGGKDGGRKVGANMILERKKNISFDPIGMTKCLNCKQQIQKDYKYCQKCAYKKGLCQMCGVQVLDIKPYRQKIV